MILKEICYHAKDGEKSAKNRNTQLSLKQGDCDKTKTGSLLLRVKEKGRWALSPEWILRIREELLRIQKKAGRGPCMIIWPGTNLED